MMELPGNEEGLSKCFKLNFSINFPAFVAALFRTQKF